MRERAKSMRDRATHETESEEQERAKHEAEGYRYVMRRRAKHERELSMIES